MTNDGPGPGHPDVNSLADLAADVLPVEEARVVEAHVIACPDCADLLADAERVRPLLRAGDEDPMPDDVWARLSAVLAEEASVRSTLQGPPVPMSPTPPPAETPWDPHWVGHDRAGAAAAVPHNGGIRHGDDVPDATLPSRRSRRARRAAEDAVDRSDGWEDVDAALRQQAAVADPFPEPGPNRRDIGPDRRPDDSDADDDASTGYTRVIRPLADLTPTSSPTERTTETTSSLPALGGSRVSGLRRPGRSGGPSRRDVRDGDRGENAVVEVMRNVRVGRRGAVLAAAAGVVVVASLGGLLWSVVGGGDSAGDPSAASSPTAPIVVAPVLETNKNYRESELGSQGAALVKQATAPNAPRVAASLASGSTAADPGSEPLAHPAVLARCLDALDASDQRPLAVDLARFKNREAAIIVLQGEDGSTEVWAVSRDCGSGDETPLAFVAVPKS